MEDFFIFSTDNRKIFGDVFTGPSVQVNNLFQPKISYKLVNFNIINKF
jgi:hypothetical protein